ncbi:MAG: DNA gyrase subunit A [Clostridia bacterium]|nr:DNA gyrase subunit A [Clostridia bacterium]
MKKKIYKEETLVIEDKTKYLDIDINSEMKKSFIAYAMAVNVSRAIPDVRDGLKPVQRRIVYTMAENGLTNDKPFRKCAKIVGDVMGKYHPHGDSSIYDALVRLAQPFSMNAILVDGHGNFGSVDGDPPAAYRYTEARMSKIASELLRDIGKNTVDYKPNYDGTEQEPEVLPARYPNLLVNGAEGIAVGMATNIPPHNLGEVIDGVIAMADNPDISIEELIDIIPAPDFPTGAIIMGRNGPTEAYKTGRGSIVVRSKVEIQEEEDTGKNRIVVTELPYGVNKARLVTSIADLYREKKVEGIHDIRDESDKDGTRIVIDVKKDSNAQVLLNYLYKHTQLQVSDGIILLALVNNVPKIINLKECLYQYLEHQKNVVRRRTQYDLEKAEERAHILEGLKIAQQNIDDVIRIIKASKDKQEATKNLMDKYPLDEIQVNAILEMRLQRLTGLEYSKITSELDELRIAINHYKDILANPQMIIDIIKTELLEIKEKHATPRKSEISYSDKDINIEDLIAKEDIVISLTSQGYVKRIAVSEYKSQRRGGMGVTAHKTKDTDFVINMFTASTHQQILCFTNKGKVYSLKGYEIPEQSKTSKGRNIVNILPLENGERVNTILPLPKDNKGFMLLATNQGLIKRMNMSEFDSIRKNGKICITLEENDDLVSAQLTTGENEIMCASSEGKCIRFDENNIRVTGRSSMGVKAMKFSEGEYLVEVIICKQDSQILTLSTLGYGKRSSIEEYRAQKRNGKGILAGKFSEETGSLIAIKQIEGNQDVIIITNGGTMIRTPIEGISVISRNTKGVKIMKLKKNEKIVSVAVVEHEEENEETENLETVEQNQDQNTEQLTQTEQTQEVLETENQTQEDNE